MKISTIIIWAILLYLAFNNHSENKKDQKKEKYETLSNEEFVYVCYTLILKEMPKRFLSLVKSLVKVILKFCKKNAKIAAILVFFAASVFFFFAEHDTLCILSLFVGAGIIITMKDTTKKTKK